MTQADVAERGVERAADNNAIRPFHVNVPEAGLTDLRRRIAATRWPTKELVEDRSQGVQLATLRKLARGLRSARRIWASCIRRLFWQRGQRARALCAEDDSKEARHEPQGRKFGVPGFENGQRLVWNYCVQSDGPAADRQMLTHC